MNWWGLLNDQTVIGIGQLLVGRYLKGNPFVSNRLIPIFSFLIALLGYNIAPQAAHAASIMGTFVNPALGLFGLALAQTFMVTGVHSTFKNTFGPAGKTVLQFLAQRILANDKEQK